MNFSILSSLLIHQIRYLVVSGCILIPYGSLLIQVEN